MAAEHPEFEGKTATFAQNGFYDGLIYAYQDGLATADTIVFATERPEDVAALRKVPTFGRLDAVAQNRAVFTDGTLAGAMYFMTR